MSASLGVVHPLIDFLDLIHRRSVATVARSLSAALHSASLQSATRHSELLAPLTWSWFRREWLSSGCRVLHLLAAHMQSAVVQSANSACAPPNPALLSAAFRASSGPRQVMSEQLHSSFDALTARLTQQRRPLIGRIHVYYTLYCIHGCQVTVEQYRVPLPRHHWQLVLDDLHTLQQLPVDEPYAVLRDLMERQSAQQRITCEPLAERALFGELTSCCV